MVKSLPKFLSIVFLITLFLFVQNSIAQTLLINPAGDGGFENGGTPAANGWTAVNATTDNWVVGIANPPGPSIGTNASYVSTDGGTIWTYSQLSTIIHLYKDVTIPAGESKVTLSFKWKVGGEGSTTSDWDNMKVFWGVASTMGVPVLNTALGSGFQVSGPGAVSGMYKLSSVSYNNETINLIGIPGTTYRLVFSWKSDVSTIVNPPAAIDEVSLISSVQTPLIGGNIYPINGTQNPPTSFESITTAVAYLGSDGVTGSGQVIFELTTGYAGEPGPVSINAIPGTSATLGVTFRPALGYTVLTSIAGAASPNQHAIKLNACNYVTLDGRAGGVGSSRDWTVRVTGSGTAGLGQMAVRMDNTSGSMTGNNVRYLIMEGEAANATGAIFQITGSTTNTISNIIIENNLIQSTSSASTSLRGYGITLAVASNVGNTGIIVRNNDITMFHARGINLTGGFPVIEVYGNNIYHTTAITMPTAIESAGIYFSTSSSPGAKVYNNYIYDLQYTNGLTSINGIQFVTSNSTGTIPAFFNNRISIGNLITTTTVPIYGFNYSSTTATYPYDVYFNSVFISGTATTGTANSAAFRKAAGNVFNLKNNIFYNARTNSGATGTHWGISVNNTTFTSIGNNDYFASGTGGVLGTTDGTTTGNKATLALWKAAVPADANSVSQNPNYIAVLKIDTSVPTQLESGGAPIAGITIDFEGDTRNVTTPDIGADEFEGIALDLTPPVISYNSLLNTGSISARTLTVSISDASGVPTVGIGLPVLYWAINSGTFSNVQATFISGSQYSFTFGAGVVLGDTVRYYLVAQDNATTPNVGAFPSVGASGFTANPPAVSTPPTAPSSYVITALPLAGDYTVGLALFNSVTGKNISFERTVKTVLKEIWVANPKSDIREESYKSVIYGDKNSGEYKSVEVDEVIWIAMESGTPYYGPLYSKKVDDPTLDLPDGIEGVYATLTAAMADLNIRGVSTNVNFLLTDSLYSTGESFPILANITNENLPSLTKKVTIKPSSGVTSKISGSSTSGIFVSFGVDCINLDGSNSGGTDRSLTFENTNSAANAYVIGIFNNGVNGAQNNSIKNCTVKAGGTVNNTWNIVLNAIGGGYNNTTVQNNLLLNARVAMQFVGVSGGITTGGLITQNIFGSDIDLESVGNLGVITQYVDGLVISGNTFKNFKVGNNPTGISLSTGSINTIVSKNMITGMIYTGTGGYGGKGIAINTGSLTSNLTIDNNVLYNILGDGWSTFATDANVGIRITGTTGGIKIYYNSVNLYGNGDRAATATLSAALYVIGTTAGLDIRNNVFANSIVNNLNAGSKSYSIYNAGTNTGFTTINNNDYYAGGIQGILGFQAVDITTIEVWRTASGQDINSIASNPNFVSNTDLRLNYPTPLFNAGTPIAGVTTDFLGVTRSVTTPTIGSYENPVATIGWANLQWPPSGAIIQGQSLTAYAQIWIDGLTNQPGPGVGIQSWIGISNTNTDPSTWTTWVPAVYNLEVGNNDEYMAMIGSTLLPGTYYYASRFNVFSGSYVYGGYNGGFWNGTTNVSGVLTVDPALNTLWERSAANATLPTWFGTDLERGLAYGKSLDGTEALNNRVFVVSRTGGLFVRILNAANGSDVSTLNTTGIAGGTFALNDVGVTDDGKIIGCNLTTNAFSSAFKLYLWDNELSSPVTVLSYVGGDSVRLGDKFTVIGNYSAGTMVIWAASATTAKHRVYKWSMSAGVINPVPQVIYCSDALTTGIASAAVGPLPNGDFFWNANGQNARKYSANGTLLGTIPGTLVGTGSNAIRYLGQVGANEYLATFIYGTGNQNARILELPNGDPTSAVLYAITTPLGTNANANGAGDVDFQLDSNLTVNVYVLATNNGLGAYKTTTIIPVELSTFAARVNEREVVVTWSTATELNNRGFDLERKLDGEWQKITYIEGRGTTTEQSDYSFTDNFAYESFQGMVQYRLKQIDFDGSISYSNIISVDVNFSPKEFALYQNYPNPFNPSTTIKFALPFTSSVNIKVFNVLGEQVTVLFNEVREAGYHNVSWNAGSLASGVYIYTIDAKSVDGLKNFNSVKKMMLVK